MEILLICFFIFLCYFLRNDSKNSNTMLSKSKSSLNQDKKELKGSIKNKIGKYNPGQIKSKPKIDPMSKVDPLEWSQYTVCNICGSENKGSIVKCHPQ